MSKQLFTDGDVKVIDGQEFECTSVTYQEDAEGVRSNFGYAFRLKSELDKEREEAAQHEAENNSQAPEGEEE